MNRAYLNALSAVRDAYHDLPPIVHTEPPREVLSRIDAGRERELSYDQAVHQAALALALVVAVDRAELNSVTSGCDGVSCSPGVDGCGCGRAA